MITFDEHIEALGLQPDTPVVSKIGGSQTCKVEAHINRLREDSETRFNPVVLSAFKREGCMMTGDLISVGNLLGRQEVENAVAMINELRRSVKQLLQGSRTHRPYTSIAKPIGPLEDLDLAVGRIFQRGTGYNVVNSGCDSLLHMDDRPPSSITGVGELDTANNYCNRAREMFNDDSPFRLFDLRQHEEEIRGLDGTEAMRGYTRGAISEFLRGCRSNGTGGAPIFPGYLPHNGNSRGCSDDTAVEVTVSTRSARSREAICSIEKDFPIMLADPNGSESQGETVVSLSYEQAHRACGEKGYSAGVVHPSAVELARENKVPIIVHNPLQPELGATLISA